MSSSDVNHFGKALFVKSKISLVIFLLFWSTLYVSIFAFRSRLGILSMYFLSFHSPVWGRGTPFPLVHLLPHLSPFYFSVSFIGFTYFLLLSIPSLSTGVVPLRFQSGGRRKRPNLGLVCCV